MRIIGGTYRGKKLFSPENGKVRPTSDRAREALFNILRSRLGSKFGDACLLDVFAGSGAFALEALSQGMTAAAAIDLDTAPLTKNAALFPQEKSKLKIIRGNALSLGKATEAYDVLFMDAPYKQDLSEPVLKKLAVGGWLKAGAFCMIEVEKDEALLLPPEYEFIEERRYGLAKVVLARRVEYSGQ